MLLHTTERNAQPLAQYQLIANVMIGRQNQKARVGIARSNLQDRVQDPDAGTAAARLHEKIAIRLAQ